MKKLILLSLFCIGIISCMKENNQSENSTSNDSISTTKETSQQGYKVGDEATDFSLKNVDEQMISLSNFPDAKGFIIIFTCNHCPYAKAYEERIIALDNKYATLGYPVIAINPNDPSIQPEDSFDAMKARTTEKGFTFPYLFDEEQKIYPIYGATKTPHVFILNKENNKNIVKYIGAIDNNYEDANAVTTKYVENAIDALLAGKEVQEKTSVAIGCSIKTKE